MERFAGAVELGGLKVLVAEEDARLRRIVRLNLEREGFSTEEASSIAECQAQLEAGGVGLVVVSSNLPGFDTQRVSLWLRLESPDRPVPVVILSFEPEDRALAAALRQAAFTLKPFDPEQLVIQVSELMSTA